MAQEPTSEPRFWAFISYSHRDQKLAGWLHRAIETYRVPRALVGRASRDGTVPQRARPLFRDREELRTSSNLGASIGEALCGSRYLIVICTPHAAVSHWVNEEIRQFKALGRADRVLCMIADGEPNATDRPESGDLECFPRAVRFAVTADGAIGEAREEPIAADVRPGKDGRENAKLKILAGLLGVDYDALRQRERRRQRQRNALRAVAALLLAVLIGAVWYRGQLGTQEAERQTELKLAETMAAKSEEALKRGDDTAALFYGAHALTYSVAGGAAPLDPDLVDLLASLRLPAASAGALDAGHYGAALVTSPDGRLASWARSDGSVVVYDVAGQRVTASFREPRGAGGLAIAPDDRTLAVAGLDGAAELIDLRTGARTAVQASAAPLHALAFEPHGRLLAVAGEDRVIRILDVAHPGVLRAFAPGDDRINAVAFSPDGSRLASACQDGTLALWNVADGSRVRAFRFGHAVRSLAFSPDGNTIAVGLFDTTARIWNANAWQEAAVLRGHERTVDALAFSRDGKVLATASDDGTATLWDVSSYDRIATLGAHTDALRAIAFAGDGTLLMAGGADGSIRQFRLVPEQYFASFRGDCVVTEERDCAVRRLIFTRDGARILAASEDGWVRVFDVATHRQLARLAPQASDALRGLALSGDQRVLAAAGYDHRITLWDWPSQRFLRSVAAHDAWVYGLAISPSGARLASSAFDGEVKLWPLPSLDPPARTLDARRDPVGDVEFSPDGRWLASAGNDTTIGLWRADTFALVQRLTGHTKGVRPLAFTPDSTTLVSAGADGRIIRWTLPRGAASRVQASQPLLGHYGPQMVWALAVSGDGKYLASGSASDDRQTVRLWDLKTGRLIARLAGHRNSALALAFSPDNKVLASGGADGTIRFWRIADAATPAAASATPLADFLSRPPYSVRLARALAAKIDSMTGLELTGADAAPAGVRAANAN